ncbi:MAG: right-handed parallel beta-helix repeat-containing protein [Phycisphaerae bacterium]|jgi:hypothetical protein|nr:right-handed parallel beta-helix repeat-containing protein [Phycisphaerae bacterium]
MTRVLSIAGVVCIIAAGCLAAPPKNRKLVFHGAKGFGVDTPAGRGGKVIRVTNLNSDGAGSFRQALETKGPRIVVFEVGGVIDLGAKSIAISEPFCTIAAQTAPSPGITLIRGGMYISTHDVLVRHLRVRPGDAGKSKRSGWEPDGISTSGPNAYNIVIDHCSISWAVDENLSASGPRTEGPEATSRRITFSNCIIAECLDNSSHAKGRHSKGSLIHDFCRNIAIIGNLYAHNARRNPYFKAYTTGVIVNNVIYNPGAAAVQLNYSDGEWRATKFKPVNCRVAIVGNVMIHGKNTRGNLAMIARRGDAYIRDNIAVDKTGKPAPLTGGRINKLKDPPVWPAGLTPLPAKDAAAHVVRYAGARPTDRDKTDKRIIGDFQRRKGRIIDSQDEVGGYAKPKSTKRKLKIPTRPAEIEVWLNRLAVELEGTHRRE